MYSTGIADQTSLGCFFLRFFRRFLRLHVAYPLLSEPLLVSEKRLLSDVPTSLLFTSILGESLAFYKQKFIFHKIKKSKLIKGKNGKEIWPKFKSIKSSHQHFVLHSFVYIRLLQKNLTLNCYLL